MPITQIRLIIAALLVTLIVGLSWLANHYHNSWIEARETISRMESQYAQLSVTAKTCSDNTEALRVSTQTKDESIKKAQVQANILAKSNEVLAQSLLNAKPGDVDSCKSAIKLYQDYKTKKETK